jgi:membrane-associated protease RseP (regulator of RpoE activity)
MNANEKVEIIDPTNETVETLSSFIEIREAMPMLTYTVIRGKIRPPLEINIDSIKRYLKNLGHFATFGQENGEHIIRFGYQAAPKPGHRRIWVNILLFVATIFTTLVVGSFQNNGNPLLHPLDLIKGIPFSFSILLILGSHELGHYFTGKAAGVDATLPYFLPVPHPLIGTMGAFIRIKSAIPNRNALVRLGVAGPLTGFAFALPITIIGLSLSKVQMDSGMGGGLGLGSSLLMSGLSKIFFSKIPAGFDIVLHPMAFAGWLGLFVTALNLLPIGQLDGGHVAYGMFGRYRLYAMIAVLVALAGLGFLWPGWWIWGLLAVFLGLRHPAPQDNISPLGTREKILALAALLVLILTFTPVPFSVF